MKFYISEFSLIIREFQNQPVSAPLAPGTAEQFIEIEMLSKQSAAFRDATRFIMVHSETAAHLAFGEDPRATTDYHKIGPGETRFYGVNAGHRLAVIAAC